MIPASNPYLTNCGNYLCLFYTVEMLTEDLQPYTNALVVRKTVDPVAGEWSRPEIVRPRASSFGEDERYHDQHEDWLGRPISIGSGSQVFGIEYNERFHVVFPGPHDVVSYFNFVLDDSADAVIVPRSATRSILLDIRSDSYVGALEIAEKLVVYSTSVDVEGNHLMQIWKESGL